MNEEDVAIPQLVAHRGDMQHYPENTWRALEAALHAGACWLEFDVQMCADGGFVLLHDETFRRTGDSGDSVFDLASLDIAASVHEPQRFGERFAATPVARLTEVLDRLAAFPGVRAMVEIKQESLDRWGLEPVIQKLIPLLETHRRQCTLIGYNAEVLSYCRQHSDLSVGWVLKDYDTLHEDSARRLAPDYLICNYTKIPRGETPWPGPWQWMVYDITDAGLALEWARRGVALVETADIGTLLEHPVLARRACRHGL